MQIINNIIKESLGKKTTTTILIDGTLLKTNETQREIDEEAMNNQP